MAAKGNPRIGQCVYCGQIGPLTRDHVPPKNLFPEPRPDNLITIPSCEGCNKDLDIDDEYFRIKITTRDDIAEHQEATPIWSRAISSLSKPSKIGFKKSFISDISIVDRVTASGLYLGKWPIMNVDLARIHRVTNRIIKGLFYKEKKFRLPDSHASMTIVNPSEINKENYESSKKIYTALCTLSAKVFGNGVFSYRVQFLQEDSNSSAWLLQFYDKFLVLGMTLKKEDVKCLIPG